VTNVHCRRGNFDTVEEYEIRIKGCGGDRVSDEFTEFGASVHPTETALRGEVRDQSELHRVLEMIQSLGLELVELRNLE
jgi:hypothetical protein